MSFDTPITDAGYAKAGFVFDGIEERCEDLADHLAEDGYDVEWEVIYDALACLGYAIIQPDEETRRELGDWVAVTMERHSHNPDDYGHTMSDFGLGDD